MKRHLTPTRLAEVAAERISLDNTGSSGHGRVVSWQPVGVRVDNDGTLPYWMQEGEDYQLQHDDIGWRVTCQTWQSSHIRRLADASKPKGSFVSALPRAGGGDVELEIGRIYQLRIDLNQMHLAELS